MFVRFNANPINKDTGDCVVRGVSLLMNQSWRDTYADLSMTAYYLSDMPSSNAAWHEYLILNGYRRYVIPDTCPACYTVREFCMDHQQKKFWLKSTSTSGVPEQLREFTFDEKTPTLTARGSVSRDEFDKLSAKIDKLINDLGGTSNG